MILDGIPGLIGKLPIVGKAWIRFIASFMAKKALSTPNFYISKPNALLQAPVVDPKAAHEEIEIRVLPCMLELEDWSVFHWVLMASLPVDVRERITPKLRDGGAIRRSA